MPFQIEDASRKIEKGQNDDQLTEEESKAVDDGKPTVRVLMKTRLDHRIIDLRTPAK